MKSIVITGATRGMGRSIAFRFAQEGFAVAVCSSSSGKVNAFRKEFARQFDGTNLIASVCDVSSTRDVMKFSALVKRKWDHLDVLVNNGGIFVDGGITDSREGAFETVMATNVNSAFHFTRQLIGLLKKSRKPHIFNMCSVASLAAYPNGALYGISKYALLGFSKSLRAELMPEQIAVTSVLPGAVLTDTWAGSGIPEKRFMQPEEIAEIIFNIYQMPKRSVVEEILIRPMGGDV